RAVRPGSWLPALCVEITEPCNLIAGVEEVAWHRQLIGNATACAITSVRVRRYKQRLGRCGYRLHHPPAIPIYDPSMAILAKRHRLRDNWAPACRSSMMSQHQALKIFAQNDWENEGGALPPAKPARVLRFLTELYVVDGY